MASLTKQTFTNQVNIIAKEDLNTAPHTLAWESSTFLVFENNELVPLTINLLGDGVTSVGFAGYGDVTVSGGFDVIVPAGDTVTVPLNSVSKFLGAQNNNVTISVTGSTAADLAFVYWR